MSVVNMGQPKGCTVMNFSISVTSFHDQTRLTVNFGGASRIFDFNHDLPFDHPILQIFGPASNDCDNIAEFLNNCGQIIHQKLKDSGQIKEELLEVSGYGYSAPDPCDGQKV